MPWRGGLPGCFLFSLKLGFWGWKLRGKLCQCPWTHRQVPAFFLFPDDFISGRWKRASELKEDNEIKRGKDEWTTLPLFIHYASLSQICWIVGLSSPFQMLWDWGKKVPGTLDRKILAHSPAFWCTHHIHLFPLQMPTYSSSHSSSLPCKPTHP